MALAISVVSLVLSAFALYHARRRDRAVVDLAPTVLPVALPEPKPIQHHHYWDRTTRKVIRSKQ